MPITHAFVSAKSDSPDAAKVQPSNWNADHSFTAAAAGASAPGDSAAEGSADTLARSDHRHGREAFGTTAGTVCQGNDVRLSNCRVPGLFGDGSDGDLNYDGSTVILGVTPSASVYTLTRDIYANNLTIANGVTIRPDGFKIFCKGTLTNNGTIQQNGGDGGNGSASAGGTAGASGRPADANLRTATYGSATATATNGGGAGGRGAAGTAGNPTSAGSQAQRLGGLGGAGGHGTAAAGAGGLGTLPTPGQGLPRSLLEAITVQTNAIGIAAGVKWWGPGTGGGGGGSSATTVGGGGGGGGGGTVAIYAKTIVNTSGTISAKGGNGGNAGGTAGNGGGGGGGGGGLVILVYESFTGNAAVVTGGTKGNLYGGGANGNDGAAGAVYSLTL